MKPNENKPMEADETVLNDTEEIPVLDGEVIGYNLDSFAQGCLETIKTLSEANNIGKLQEQFICSAILNLATIMQQQGTQYINFRD